MTNKKNNIKQALGLLTKVFDLNKEVKVANFYNCGTHAEEFFFIEKNKLYKKNYRRKELLLKKVIDLIIKNKLPIKYGSKSDESGYASILYFEYLHQKSGKRLQVSFHDKYSVLYWVKPFDGYWVGYKQNVSPCKKIKKLTKKCQ